MAQTAAKRKSSELLQETWDLQAASRSAGTGSGNQLESITRQLERSGKTLKVPIDMIAVPYFGAGVCQHPVFSISKFLSFMISEGFSKLFLGGYDVRSEDSKRVLKQYWLRYAKFDPHHDIFEAGRNLEDHVPLMVYGDEGTVKRRHPCYILATKFVLNCRTSSWARHILYSCLPHELYSGYHKGTTKPNECLDAVVQQYSLDAQSLFEQGMPRNILKEIRPFCLGPVSWFHQPCPACCYG